MVVSKKPNIMVAKVIPPKISIKVLIFDEEASTDFTILSIEPTPILTKAETGSRRLEASSMRSSNSQFNKPV